MIGPDHRILIGPGKAGSAEPASVGTPGLDLDLILDLGDAGSRPGGLLGKIALEPGVNLAAEDHLAGLGTDCDVRGVEFRAATQGPLDLFPDSGMRTGGATWI